MENLVKAFEKAVDVVLSRVTQLVPLLLALAVTTLMGSVIAALMVHSVPADSHDALMLLVGSLGGNFGAIIAFYFGSSAGSAKKTEIMANMKGDQK